MLSASGLDRLHVAMATRVEHKELPGLSMLIARGDEIHVDSIGVKAFESGEPIERDTLFRIASMTKPVVAAAAMMLVEQGKIAVEDPVDRWLPEMANRRVLKRIDGPLDETVPANRPITLEDLLTLRMGFGMIVEPSMNPPYPVITAASEMQLALFEPDPRTPHSPDEWIKQFGTLPLMYQPGERWQYNVGSLVLGVLVARVAGQPLEEALRVRVFEPLGMHSTGFWLPLEVTQGLPSHYMTNFGTNELERLDVSTPEEWSRPPAFPSGAGGLLSTVDDYLAFARLLLNNGMLEGKRLLSEASVKAMTTNQLSDQQVAGGGVFLGGEGWGYGQGVAIQPSAEWPVRGRYGWSGGYGTNWFNDPYTGTIAIVMTQVSPFLWTGGLGEFTGLVGRL